MLRYRWLWLAIGWLLVVAVFVLSLIPKPPTLDVPDGDKIGHLLAYACLMFWFGQLYWQRKVRLRYALGFVLMGIVIEFLQAFTPARSFELADMAADAIGVALGYALALTPLQLLLQRVESLLSTVVRAS